MPFCCYPGYCSYNNETKEAECRSCYSQYALSKDKKCTSCGKNCDRCSFDEKDNLVCTLCMYPYTLYNGACQSPIINKY